MPNKQKLFSLISYLIIGAILAWLLVILLKNWRGIADYHFKLKSGYLFLAFLFSVGAVLMSCFVWRWLFDKFSQGQRVSFWLVFKVRNYALLGKYLPGRVFAAAGQAYFSKKEGWPAKPAALAALFELALSLLAHFLLSLLLFWLFLRQSGFLNLETIALAALLLFLGLLFLHPKIIGWLINNFLAKIKKTAVPKEAFLSYQTMLTAALGYLPVIFANGLAFAFLGKAILAENSPGLLFLSAAFVASGFLGNFVVFAPGGLGVREGALTFLLKKSIGSPLAVLLSLFSRLWFVAVDFLLLAFTFLAIKAQKLYANRRS